MKTILIAALLISSIAFFSNSRALHIQARVESATALQSVSAGTMFRANPQRTGVYQTEGVRRLHGIKWKFKTERVIEAWFSSPTIVDGVAYFGSDDGYLYAVKTLFIQLQ
jgi:hypothetical protein